jgi:glutamate N-acetyltransferase/amino-acid N-acetyltransferase
MSVTAAAGFEAAGVAAGLRAGEGPDVAVVVNRGPSAAAAAVFTTNRCTANPIIWSKQVIKDGVASAIVLNAGGANCYTGMLGFQTTHATAEAAGRALDLSPGDVLVCSTGLIGEQLDTTRVVDGVIAAAARLGRDGGADAARAIMTTDTRPKQAVSAGDGYTIGGMAKGAGMLAPGLATMLVVLTTDADLESPELDAALRGATRVTFDRLDSDGCMSTNDQVTLLASGASGVTPDPAEFGQRLTAVCLDLALQLQSDAEGASHDIAIETRGAASEDDAVTVSRAIARSNLFKAAVFGDDPNWGRVLAAVGTTDAEFDPFGIDVEMNGVRVCQAGQPDQPRELVDLTDRRVSVVVDLHTGTASATVWTNDLTHEYVRENSSYSS